MFCSSTSAGGKAGGDRACWAGIESPSGLGSKRQANHDGHEELEVYLGRYGWEEWWRGFHAGRKAAWLSYSLTKEIRYHDYLRGVRGYPFFPENFMRFVVTRT
jgi:hypothetical protein